MNQEEERIVTFAYKSPGEAKRLRNKGYHIIDCRVLPNPWKDRRLRDLPGDDPQLIAFLVAHATPELIENLLQAASKHDRVAFGCVGGRHRSVAMAHLFEQKLH